MKIGIIDIGIGNLRSIQNMLTKIGVESDFVKDKAKLESFDKLILPGMGSFDRCMIALNESGIREKLEVDVFERKKPFLGICVGLQMLMRKSEEGVEPGLNWIPGDTVKFDSCKMTDAQKIPNLGWLEVFIKNQNKICEGLSGSRFYFAHSYHVVPDYNDDQWLRAKYGYEFTAAVSRQNIYGVQFHPEKSHKYGMQLLKNFAFSS